MTIFAPNYSPPPPTLEPRNRRTLAILSHQLRVQLGALNIVLLVFIFIVVVLPLTITAYLQQLVPGFVGTTTLSTFYGPIGQGIWFILLILLVSSAGAPLIARDVATKATTMYLSRPIEPIDYLGAKAGALAAWVLLGGVLPGWVGSIILLALGYVSLPLALEAMGAYLVVGIVAIAAFTGLAVLLSSLTPRSTLAGAGILGGLLGTFIVVSVLSGITGTTGFLYVSPVHDLLGVAAGVFEVSGSPLNPWSAGAVLAGFAVGTYGLTYARLLRTQVISE